MIYAIAFYGAVGRVPMGFIIPHRRKVLPVHRSNNEKTIAAFFQNLSGYYMPTDFMQQVWSDTNLTGRARAWLNMKYQQETGSFLP